MVTFTSGLMGLLERKVLIEEQIGSGEIKLTENVDQA